MPILTLSHSKLETWHACQQLYARRYFDRMQARSRPFYRVFGSALHKYLEHYYTTRGKDSGQSLLVAKAVFDTVDRGPLNGDEIHDLECQLAMVLGICESYPTFYAQDFIEFPVMKVELSFWKKDGLVLHNVEGNTVYYEGQLDGLFQDAAGDWWIFETKTAAPQTLTEAYFEKIHIDSQVLGYMHLAKKLLGEFPRGIIYNVVKKPGIRLRKGETKGAFKTRVREEYTVHGQSKQYFQRAQLDVSRNHLDDWLKEKRYTASQILGKYKDKRAKREVFFPRNTGNCLIKYGPCEFMRACIDNSYNKLLYQRRQSREDQERAQKAAESAQKEKKAKAKPSGNKSNK